MRPCSQVNYYNHQYQWEVQHLRLQQPGGIFDNSKRFQGHMIPEQLKTDTFKGLVKEIYSINVEAEVKPILVRAVKMDDAPKDFANLHRMQS